MARRTEIKVWDPFVRVFHWALVAAFSVAYVTEDEWLGVHSWAGYLVLGLVLTRIVWGLMGTRYARFTDFVQRPSVALAYLKDVFRGTARRYIGHNPAGGLMIVLMMISLLLTGISGIALYGLEEGAGPLAAAMAGYGHGVEEALEEGHEFLANLTLLMVVIHVAGVVVESLVHGENLVRSMIHGRKLENPE